MLSKISIYCSWLQWMTVFFLTSCYNQTQNDEGSVSEATKTGTLILLL